MVNVLYLLGLGVIWRIVAYVAFIFKYRSKSTVYGHDKELFNLYCKRNAFDDDDENDKINKFGKSNMAVLDNGAVDQNGTHDLITVNE